VAALTAVAATVDTTTKKKRMRAAVEAVARTGRPFGHTEHPHPAGRPEDQEAGLYREPLGAAGRGRG
jgi:hypothetical protein